MKVISHILFLTFAIWCNSLCAAIPSGYYSSAEGLSSSSLKTALCNIIDNQVDNGYGFLWTLFRTSDVRPNGKVWDIYSTCTFSFGSADQCGGSYTQICDCYNREHIVPQSWFNEAQPMRSDGFHIYPTDGKVNALRSNYPHGETKASPIGSEALGNLGASSIAGYTGTVYEPADEYKGDIARSYFYFVTRYEVQLSNMHGTVLTTAAYPGLTSWFLNLMLTWHRQDPVSQKEIDRNEAIYIAQLNRNPFIDYPNLAEHIWGNLKNNRWFANGNGITEPSSSVNLSIYPQPAHHEVTLVGNFSSSLHYQIIDLNGHLVEQGTCNGSLTIALDNIPTGLYLLKIQDQHQSSVLKLIVKHT